MFPIYATFDVVYGGAGYAEHMHKGSPRYTSCRQFANTDDIFSCQLGVLSRFPFSISILSRSIVIIVFLRTQEQVIWSHTSWVVTLMQDVHSFWNWLSGIQHEAIAVCAYASTANSQYSISMLLSCNPYPAVIVRTLLNPAPEAFGIAHAATVSRGTRRPTASNRFSMALSSLWSCSIVPGSSVRARSFKTFLRGR